MSNKSTAAAIAALNARVVTETTEPVCTTFAKAAARRGSDAYDISGSFADAVLDDLPICKTDSGLIYVYLWRVTLCGDRFFKVGVSRKLRERIRAFRSYFPPSHATVEPMMFCLTQEFLGELIETEVIKEQAHRWCGGEWIADFDLAKEEVAHGR